MGKRKSSTGCKFSRYHKGGKGGHPWKWMREEKRPKRSALANKHFVRVWRGGGLNVLIA